MIYQHKPSSILFALLWFQCQYQYPCLSLLKCPADIHNTKHPFCPSECLHLVKYNSLTLAFARHLKKNSASSIFKTLNSIINTMSFSSAHPPFWKAWRLFLFPFIQYTVRHFSVPFIYRENTRTTECDNMAWCFT